MAPRNWAPERKNSPATPHSEPTRYAAIRTMLFDTTTATAKTHVTKAKKRKKKLSQWMADMVSKLLPAKDELRFHRNCW